MRSAASAARLSVMSEITHTVPAERSLPATAMPVTSHQAAWICVESSAFDAACGATFTTGGGTS